jgi:hypothetical protein
LFRTVTYCNKLFSLDSLPISQVIYAPRKGCQGKPDNAPWRGEGEVSAPEIDTRNQEAGVCTESQGLCVKPGAERSGTPQAQQERWPGLKGYLRLA